MEVSLRNTGMIKKGDLGGQVFNAWDFVKNCSGEKCNISHLCEYPRSGRCGIEVAYLEAVLQPFNEILESEGDIFLNQAVGLRLIPLYHDLIKLKKAKLCYDTVMYMGNKSNPLPRVNPLFNEVRQQIKAIRDEMIFSGLHDILKRHGYLGGVIDNDLGKYLRGEDGYYERMSGV